MRKFILVLFLLSMTMLQSANPVGLISQPLTQNWEFRKKGDGQWLAARVPGCVHDDLQRNGLMKDYIFRNQELDVQWVEKEDWEYRLRFTPDPDALRQSRIDLVFDGLDTYAEVSLNGTPLLVADNMFVAWEKEVKNLLKPGENELVILFRSPVNEGMKKLRQLPYILKVTNEIAPEDQRSNIFTRKAPFHYGWDWGPRLVTSGIWKPVSLRAWSEARIDEVFLEPVSITPELARYQARVDIVAAEAGTYEAEIAIGGVDRRWNTLLTVTPGNATLIVPFEISQPTLWWSHGLGDPHLYPVTIRLKKTTTVLDEAQRPLGVRTLELVQEPDSFGRSFYFRLNGVPVFMKGANYIPSHIFTQLQTPEVYERLVNDALEANMNMLRVWGGAVYEDDYFYDLCDRKGILVWQDFMFACALNPGDSLHLENIRKEARFQVKRLRHHPSLALWCGNNENLIAWHRWGWKQAYPQEISDQIFRDYETIFYDILPRAVGEFNPQIGYWPSSPQSYGNELPDRNSGDEHDWTIWFAEAPFANYGNHTPRFVSEYGMQAYPAMATLKSFTEAGDLSYRSSVMEQRQRSFMPWIGPNVNGNEMIRRYVLRYFREPKDFDQFVYVSQLMQAEGFKAGIEAHRRNMPKCMGSLYWQINDCWPTVSWSSVDYYGRWKASHFAVKEAFKPFAVIPVEENGQMKVYAVSDKLQDQSAQLSLRLFALDGQLIWEKTETVTVKANTSAVVWSADSGMLRGMGDLKNRGLEVRLLSGSEVLAENHFFFLPFKDLNLPQPNIQASVSPAGDGLWRVTVTTDQWAQGVFLETTEGQGRFSHNFFPLAPGATQTLDLRWQGRAGAVPGIQVRSLRESY